MVLGAIPLTLVLILVLSIFFPILFVLLAHALVILLLSTLRFFHEVFEAHAVSVFSLLSVSLLVLPGLSKLFFESFTGVLAGRRVEMILGAVSVPESRLLVCLTSLSVRAPSVEASRALSLLRESAEIFIGLFLLL